MKHTWTVDREDSRKRLDIFVAEKLPEVTRSQIAKLLKSGAGTVNGKPATVHRFLNPGDKVEFDDIYSAAGAGLSRQTEDAKIAPLPKLHIIDETKDFIVIDKPTGLLVHPDSKQQTGTLVDLLLDFDPKIAKIGEYPERPGIMHRLDKEVSGLMVVARTQMAFDSLKQQFAEHSVDKKYLALVFGEMNKDEGDIKFRIAHSKTKNRMAARPKHEEEGKAAWTHYTVLKRFRHATLVELTILSGRTHQIRAHLLALGHPIMGDELYTAKAPGRSLKAPRLMLQCIRLGFKDPKTGEPREYELKPVNAFAEMEKKLS
ncbi:RluA family pseudouridine synthase [Candidatus Uhrbacteria bacterium]|nr:RluA family pseudouridine synthase [Candidatus Uhrbacteria bacterium]